jgi:hypothetical protein
VGINIWVYLSDLQQNRIYGGFHRSTNIGLFYCSLQDKECHSEAEWNPGFRGALFIKRGPSTSSGAPLIRATRCG